MLIQQASFLFYPFPAEIERVRARLFVNNPDRPNHFWRAARIAEIYMDSH